MVTLTTLISFFLLAFFLAFLSILKFGYEFVLSAYLLGLKSELWMNHYLQSKETGCGKPMHLYKLV